MKIIIIENLDILECPFISDLGSCRIVPSKINSCPVSIEDEAGFYVQVCPDFCPLKSGDVTVSLSKPE